MLRTGVPNLDRILGGGIPEGDVVLITGPAGAGKTTLALEICFHAVAAGKRAVYVSTLAEPPPRLLRHIRSFSFYDEARIGAELRVLDIYPIVKEGVEPTIDAIVAAVREHSPTVLVVDGIDTIRDLHAGQATIRYLVYELAVALSGAECTTLFTSSVRPDHGAPSLPELTMSDTLVVLGLENVDGHAARTLELRKVRGQAALLGRHGFGIDRDGVRVHPRIESIVQPSGAGLSKVRRPFGLPELDAMLSGGLVCGSSTVVAGPPGTGKTTLGLQFVLEGARRAERGLVFTFREPPELLVDKMRAFGLDLESPCKQGWLTLRQRTPIDASADELLDDLVRELDSAAPDRLLIDNIGEIEHAEVDQRRRRAMLVSLTELLRSRDITAVLTRGISQRAGSEMELSETPLTALGENVILLRDASIRGELLRIVSVLEMRDAPHDRTIRRYEIDRHGLKVLSSVESVENVTGRVARLASEICGDRSAELQAER